MSHNAYSPTRLMARELLFHPDPQQRQLAAEALGTKHLRASEESEALEALTMAVQDPALVVQETALQSLVRISAK